MLHVSYNSVEINNHLFLHGTVATDLFYFFLLKIVEKKDVGKMIVENFHSCNRFMEYGLPYFWTSWVMPQNTKEAFEN